MNKKINLKIVLFINIALLIILIAYKSYLTLYESNFDSKNIKNINRITQIQDSANFSFVVLGNIENSIDIFDHKMIDAINADPSVSFVISTGNSVLDGAEDKYRMLNRSLNKINVPVVLCAGTNELSDGGDRRFYQHFGPYYFSFEKDGNYFICLDTTGSTSIEWQKSWLTRELKYAAHFSKVFVFMNEAPFNIEKDNKLTETSGDVENDAYRNFLTQSFSQNHVTAVFSSGAGIYEESQINGVQYFVSGGGGGGILKHKANSFFHYMKINVSADGLDWEIIRQDLPAKYASIRTLENIWVMIHSFFYVNFINFVLILVVLLLIAISIIIRVSKNVDYYRNYHKKSNLTNDHMPLNIAFFTNNYFPFIGGVPISIDRLARGLRKRGHRVVIFAPDYPEFQEEDQLDVVRLKLLTYYKTKQYNFPLINIFSKQTENEFNKYKFDVIHVHHPFWLGKKGLGLGIKHHVPVIWTYHTRLESYNHNLPFFQLAYKNIFSHTLINKFAQKCNGIIAPTYSAIEYLENIGVSRIKKVIPTGIEADQYRLSDDRTINTLRKQFTADGEILICSVSRLTKEKNLLFLLNALRIVKNQTAVKFKCIIIGEGPLKEELQQFIDLHNLNGIILLLGSVAQSEIPKYYLASDLFVFSSMSETQGIVILEAMTGGCPVVAVRSSGIDDIIIDEYNGFKTDDDALEWSNRVIQMLENPELLKEMSKNAYNYSKTFTMDQMTKKVESLYYQVIDK